MSKIICAGTFTLFTFLAAPIYANTHAHVQVYNYTDGRISVSCQDHHHKAAGKVSSLAAYGDKRMSLYSKGKIHCKAKNNHNEVIGRKSFNITNGDRHIWEVLQEHH